MPATHVNQQGHERGEHLTNIPEAIYSQLDYDPASLKAPPQDQSKPDALLAIGGQFLDWNESNDGRSENAFAKEIPFDFIAHLNDSGYSPSKHISQLSTPLANKALYGSPQALNKETPTSFFDSGYGSTSAEPYANIAQPYADIALSQYGSAIRKRRKFSKEERLQTSAVRKVGACGDCRRRKVRCVHVTIDTLALPPGNGGFENDQWRELKGVQEQAVRNSIADAKHQALTFLMKHVYAKLNFRYYSNIKTCAGDETQGSSEPLKWSTSGQSRQGVDPQNGKRARSDDGSLSDEHNGKRGRPHKIVSKEPNLRKHFACPFHKNDPQKYSCNDETGILYRTCSTTKFKDMGEVKQHCERIHRNVAQCPRCWTVMKNQKALGKHRQQPCELRPEQPEGISDPKWALIKNKTERITWNEFYGILFPGDAIPCCQFQQSDIDRKRSGPRSRAETVRRETLRLVEERLYRVLDSELGPIVERILASLDEDITSCQRAAETKIAQKDSEPSERLEMSPKTNVFGATGTDSHNLIGQVPSGSNPINTLEAMVTNNLCLSGAIRPMSLNSGSAVNVDSGYQSGYGACPCSCHVLANSQRGTLCSNIGCRDRTCSWSSSVTTKTGDSHGIRNLRPDAIGSKEKNKNNGSISPNRLEISVFEATRSTADGNAHNKLNPNNFDPIGFDNSRFNLDNIDLGSFEFNEDFDFNYS